MNTKLEDMFVVKYVAYIHPSSFTIVNVTVHIKSAVNVHAVVAHINVTVHIKSALTVYIYSFKVTNNENIHTVKCL